MSRDKLYLVLKGKKRNCSNRDVRIKLELILLGLKLGSISEACARRGFSRKFYHKWFKRLKAAKFDLVGLEERSRRPKSSPNKIGKKLEQDIRWFSRRQYGARMIQAMLKREKKNVSKTTICHVLNKREKPSQKRRNRLKKHRKRYELAIPGQRMQLDVKYVPEKIDGKQIYNYVIVDECTRWRYARAYDQISEGTTVDFLEHFKRSVPFPVLCIQTDNGQEFTYALNPIAKHLEHKMDTWCKQNGIRHRLIPPGEKEINGKVERSHRIDEQYFYWKAPTQSLTHLNAALSKWIHFYNHKRLHGGVGYLTPIEKLSERLEALKTESIDASLEFFKLRFLRESPMRLTKHDRQLQKLENQLFALLKAA